VYGGIFHSHLDRTKMAKLTYEEFVSLYERNYKDLDWFYGEFYHIQLKYPKYVDRYIAANLNHIEVAE
jgi:hypothetical protein